MILEAKQWTVLRPSDEGHTGRTFPLVLLELLVDEDMVFRLRSEYHYDQEESCLCQAAKGTGGVDRIHIRGDGINWIGVPRP